MNNPRQLIRDAFVSCLVKRDAQGEYPTLCLERVYPQRLKPLTEKDMPACCIFFPTETSEPRNISSDQSPTIRRLEVAIEIFGSGGDAKTERELNNISFQIEQVLDEFDPVLPPLPHWDCRINKIEYQKIETDIAAEGERLITMMRMLFEVTYETEYKKSAEILLIKQISTGFTPEIGAEHISNYQEIGEGSK